MWRAGFGRGFGRVVRQTAKLMNGDGQSAKEGNCVLLLGTEVQLGKKG
jgi:hypothetical protein